MSSVVSWEQTSNLMCQMHWSVTMGNYIPGCHTAVSAVWAFSAVHVGTLNYSSSNELGTFDSIQTFTEASQEFSHQFDIQRNWALNLYCTLNGFQNYEFARRVCGHIQVVARVFSSLISSLIPQTRSIPCTLMLPLHFWHISTMNLNMKSLSELHAFAYDVSSTFPTYKHFLILQNPINIYWMDEWDAL